MFSANALWGPLTAPELRRTLARRNPWQIRTIAAVLWSLPVFLSLWLMWVESLLDAGSAVQVALLITLYATGAVACSAVLLLAPAQAAGALAEEKTRGTLEILLLGRASAWDIAIARLAGRTAPLIRWLAAGIPLFLFLGSLNRLTFVQSATLLIVPWGLAIGAGGLALGASAWLRRGRDALLVSLAFVAVLVAGLPILASFIPDLQPVVRWVQPFSAMGAAVFGTQVGPSLVCAAIWSALGLTGVALGAWRLRPAAWETKSRGRARRLQSRRPPVEDAPMLWKERYIDSGRPVRGWASACARLAIGLLLLANLGLACWPWILQWGGPALASWKFLAISDWMFALSTGLSWVLQWSLGLKAAVAVAAEREQNTWDSLLCSPLTGGEIVKGKLLGSVISLRWLWFIVPLSWFLAALSGAAEWDWLCVQAVWLAAGSALIVVLGVYFSLTSATVARSMSMTLAAWMAVAAGTAIIAVMIAAVMLLLWITAWAAYHYSVGLFQSTGIPRPPIPSFQWLYVPVRLGLYVLTTLLFLQRLVGRFDSLAGRSDGLGKEMALLVPVSVVDPASGEPALAAAQMQDEALAAVEQLPAES